MLVLSFASKRRRNKRNSSVLFYASTKSKRLFSLQQFYKTDIELFRELGYNVLLSNHLIDFFCFWKYDISFIYFYRYGFFAGLISRLFGKKVYYTGGIDNLCQEYTTAKLFLIQKVFFRLCYFVSTKCIVVSDSDMSNIKKHFPLLDTKKMPISYHVVNTKKYNLNSQFERKKIVLTICWMITEENVIRKGVDSAIYLFYELVKRDPEFRMIIIGPIGLGTVYLQSIIAKLNLEGKVEFTDSIDESEKIKYLSSALVYLQLSKYEGFGLAAIEALASGCIVVHTNAGGLKLGIGDHGIISDVESSSSVKIAGDLLAVLMNREEIRLRQQAGFNYIKSKFDYSLRLSSFAEIIGITDAKFIDN